MEEDAENREAPLTAGAMIRKARVDAGVAAADLCASLRISVAALEAVEAGQYHRLPGDPYVRALLGSIARSLGMDAQKLLQAYNSDIGAAAAQPSVAPYKDISQVHLLAHRKLFIALLAVLLLALLFILARVNSSSGKNKSAENTALKDTVAMAASPAAESLPVSPALRPDSTAITVDSATKITLADEAHASRKPPAADTARVAHKKRMADSVRVAHKKKVADTVHVAQKPALVDTARAAQKPAAAADSAHPAAKSWETMNRVVIKPLIDSAKFRAYHKGMWAVAETLSLGKPAELIHRDTITFVLFRSKSVEISFGDTTLIPAKRHFKIFGKHIIYP